MHSADDVVFPCYSMSIKEDTTMMSLVSGELKSKTAESTSLLLVCLTAKIISSSLLLGSSTCPQYSVAQPVNILPCASIKSPKATIRTIKQSIYKTTFKSEEYSYIHNDDAAEDGNSVGFPSCLYHRTDKR